MIHTQSDVLLYPIIRRNTHLCIKPVSDWLWNIYLCRHHYRPLAILSLVLKKVSVCTFTCSSRIVLSIDAPYMESSIARACPSTIKLVKLSSFVLALDNHKPVTALSKITLGPSRDKGLQFFKVLRLRGSFHWWFLQDCSIETVSINIQTPNITLCNILATLPLSCLNLYSNDHILKLTPVIMSWFRWISYGHWYW